MPPTRLAVLDGPSLYMRYKRTHDPATAAARGVRRALEFCHEVAATHAVVGLECDFPNVRLADCPEYKHDRGAYQRELHDAGREAFHRAGFYWAQGRGYEADDLCGTWLARTRGRAAVLSGDSDLLEFADRHDCYRIDQRGQYERMPPELVLEKFQVLPAQLLDFKALRGEDGVAGVPGIGKVRGARLLAEHGSLDALAGVLPPEHFALALRAREALRLRTDAPVEPLRAADCVVPVR